MDRRIAASLAVALLGLLAPAAGADPGPASHVDSVAATVGAASLQVSGQATFVDVPVLVAQDATGDASPPLPGTDLASATISRPDPTRTELKVSMAVANADAAIFTVPEVVHYSFFFGVGEGGGDGQYLLQALRTAQVQAAGSANPFFRLMRFNGTSCCTPVQLLTGSMASGKVEWTVPLGPIAAAGKNLTAHPIGTRQIQIQLGASGQQWLNNAQPDFMTFETEYAVPDRKVELGVAPAGTPADQVVLTGSGTVTSTGAFTGSLPKPSAGSHVVVARACFGPLSCGLASTTVTV